MHIQPFRLERLFAQYEFKARYLLSPSDCEGLAQTELLKMANPDYLDLWNDLKLGYTESAGHPLLRLQVSRLYETVPPDQVMVAVPEEAIFIVMHTLLSAGDHVIAVSPAYQSLHEIALSIGCQLTPWKLHPGNGKWMLDMEVLEKSIHPRTRIIILNFPHNPTGYMLSHSQLGMVIDLARKHNLYVFSDEMYSLLEYDPAMRLPAVCDLYEKGISLSGLSKAFALPGLRIGWLASQDRELVDRWLIYKDYTTICSSAPSEILGIIALDAKDKILRRNLDIIQKNLSLVRSFMDEFGKQIEWLPPEAGSVAFPRWKGKMSLEAFCQDMIDQRGVMIVPASIFDYPGNHFRIGLGRNNLGEALQQVREFLVEKKSWIFPS